MSGNRGEDARSFVPVRWLAAILAGVFCLYRLAGFTPQPLDSPGTLRPVLYRWFTWFLALFGARQAAFDAWFTICGVALLVPAVLAILHYGTTHGLVRFEGGARRVLCSRGLFFISLAGCLLLCRYPTLLENELNPDEGQFLSAAHKLFYDPIFFHSVDCGTSGPINIYPLMLPAVLGFSPDFASSRMVVLLTIFLTALLFYRSVALLAPEEIARIAVLPYIGAFAVFRDPELVHYSSEHIPMLLISLALYLSVRVLRCPRKYTVTTISLGLLSSAAFFAKMQSVPIVAGLGLVALAYIYASGHAGKLWRPALLYSAGAVSLIVLNAALCISAGVWGDFWASYITSNFSYGDVDSPFITKLQVFMDYLMTSNEFRFFLFTVLAVGAAWLIEKKRQQKTGVDESVRWFGLLALVSIAGAAFAVYKPHHAFVHYLLLLFVPLCTWVAWMLIGRHIAFLALVIALICTYQNYLWSFQDSHVFQNVMPEIRAPEGDFIRSLTTAHGQIFVWGWTVLPYLSSGHVPSPVIRTYWAVSVLTI